MYKYLFFIILLFGCSAPENNIEFKESYEQVWTEDPTLRVGVIEAIARWNTATGRNWEFKPGSNIVEFGSPPTPYIAWNYGSTITVGTQWKNSPRLNDVILHEVGHYFDGSHIEDGNTMGYGLLDKYCLTEQDIIWACNYFNCTVFEPEC